MEEGVGGGKCGGGVVVWGGAIDLKEKIETRKDEDSARRVRAGRKRERGVLLTIKK